MRLLITLPCLAAVLLMAGCGSKLAEQPQAAATAAKPAPIPPPVDSLDPRKVLVGWAKAISLRQWDEAYGYWGDHGNRSGQTLEQFRAEWDKLKTPELEIREGQAEGAAGSLFYTAPVTLIDGAQRTSGEVVLRRVNDVDGATPEQLRWHLESTTLKP